LILSSSALVSQELPAKVKEFGIGLSSFNSFSLQYRWGNEKRLFRINAVIGGSTSFGNGTNNFDEARDTSYKNSNSTTSKSTSPLNINGTLSFSILRIKQIKDKFGLFSGPTIGVSYLTSNIKTTETGTGTYYTSNSSTNSTFPINRTTEEHFTTLRPTLGLVLGVVYKINASFLIYAEISPNLYYAYNTTSNKRIDNTSQPSQYISSSNSTSSGNTFGVSNLSNSAALLTIAYRITK